MRSLKISRSKSRSLSRELSSSTEILHKGFKRKLAYSEYVKICPRPKLKMNHNQMIIKESNYQSSHQKMASEVDQLRKQCKIINEQNLELGLKIKKQTRIRQIYEKRINKSDPKTVPFEKLLQVKLIFEAQQLQQILAQKIENLKTVQNFQKQHKEQLQQRHFTCINTLCNILYCDSDQIEKKKSFLFEKYYKLTDQLSNMILKKRQQKKKQNEVQQQIYHIEQEIKRVEWHLNRDNECLKEFHQSSRMGGSSSRARMIEETQREIILIKDALQREEKQMHATLYEKMKIKCQVISSVQELKQLLKAEKRVGVLEPLKFIKW